MPGTARMVNRNAPETCPHRTERGNTMSLTVSADLIDQAQRDDVTDEAFVSCIRESLPYAWSVISQLAGRMAADGGQFADNQVPPPDEAARGRPGTGRTATTASSSRCRPCQRRQPS